MANTIILKDLLQKETIMKLEQKLVIAPMANNKYEGELKQQGDTVTVQTFPFVNLTYGGTAGDAITATDWAITSENLQVTEVFQGAWIVKDIEKIRSNLELISKLAESIAYAMALTYDRYVASLAVTGALTANQIVPGAPVALNNTAGDANNVMTRIGEIGVKLRKQNAFKDPVLFVNPAISDKIVDSNLYTAFDAGFPHREQGAVGMVKGFKVYQTNDLPYRYLNTVTAVATADNTYVFTVVDNIGTSHTITFTAKAVPSAAGEFDIAGTASAQQTIIRDMINGTGTPGATSYIALSAADRSWLKSANVYCDAFDGSNTARITMSQNATLAATLTTNTLGTKGVVLFAMDSESVHFVKQEDGYKVEELQGRFASQASVENAYGGKVFAENSKRIATIDVTNE
jgi:hypothetical protein